MASGPSRETKKRSPQVPTEDWLALVLHTDGQTEELKLKQILEFHPLNSNDFDKKKKYTVRSKKWHRAQQWEDWRAYILAISGKICRDPISCTYHLSSIDLSHVVHFLFR